MKRPTLFGMLLACGLATLSFSAAAECENEDAAHAAVTQLKAEIASVQQKNKLAMSNAMRSLDAKGEQLGWDQKKKAAFLEALQEKAAFLKYELEKQIVIMKVMNVQDELKQDSVRNDPVQACKVGMKMAPLMQQMDALNQQQIDFIAAQIQAAR